MKQVFPHKFELLRIPEFPNSLIPEFPKTQYWDRVDYQYVIWTDIIKLSFFFFTNFITQSIFREKNIDYRGRSAN